MSVSSKTGLIPSQKNINSRILSKSRKSSINLQAAPVTKRIELSVRPFGTLYNPYSKGCSVLCNHPAPSAVRNIIKKVKNSLVNDGKNCDTIQNEHDQFETVQLENPDQIPEELFRRYTDTDSRPLTPSPTTGSIRTRITGLTFFSARRCVTPEFGKDTKDKRKKIILDLRRSHSQETLHWKAPSEVSQSLTTAETENVGKSPQEKRASSKLKKSEDSRQKSANTSINEEQPVTEEPKPITCINEHDPDELDYLQRRGKKRKKSTKPQTVVSSASFHLSQDPETQVSTLGPDSLNASTRPSLVPNTTTLLTKNDITQKEIEQTPLKDSFLTQEAFNALKTELDIDTIENTFERYLNRARKEAIKFVPSKDRSKSDEETTILLKSLGLCFDNNNKMPRKLSKSSARFEMPINLKALENMTVFEYLSQHVWVSRQRKQLYKRTFLKYVIEEEEQQLENDDIIGDVQIIERFMPVSNISKALEEVLGFYGTKEIVDNVIEMVFDDAHHIISFSFRSWCGIVAFAERFTLTNPSETDSCDELEKADFETMEERIDSMKVTKSLRNVLFIIRKGHCCM